MSSKQDQECPFLSGKQPFFDVVLAKSHLRPHYHMYIPSSVVPLLPRSSVQVVMRYGGKTWSLSYNGDDDRPRFHGNWAKFVDDNRLKIGDACVFQLTDRDARVFKVLILRRSHIPPELLRPPLPPEDSRSLGKRPIQIDD